MDKLMGTRMTRMRRISADHFLVYPPRSAASASSAYLLTRTFKFRLVLFQKCHNLIMPAPGRPR